MSKSSLNLFIPAKAPSHRQQRVAQEVRFCLSQIFMRNDWPVRFDEQGDHVKPPASLTITDVSISTDLKYATVWVMPLGGANRSEAKIFLDMISGYLRKQISSQLHLRSVPALRFEVDKTLDHMATIDGLLKVV
jgi:ribosome-binding factor A